MYFYEIGYSDWEACPITTLWHVKEFSQEEFNQLLLDCYAEANEINKKKHNEWYTVWSEEEKKKGEEEYYIEHMSYKPRVHDLSDRAIEILIEKHGFNHMDIIAKFIPDDTYDIVPDKDEGKDRRECKDELVLSIRDRLNTIEPRDKKINNIINTKDNGC